MLLFSDTMTVMQICLLIWLVTIEVSWSAPDEDEVTFIPGLDPQPDFKHYAGYLDATDGKHHFYWYAQKNILDLNPVIRVLKK